MSLRTRYLKGQKRTFPSEVANLVQASLSRRKATSAHLLGRMRGPSRRLVPAFASSTPVSPALARSRPAKRRFLSGNASALSREELRSPSRSLLASTRPLSSTVSEIIANCGTFASKSRHSCEIELSRTRDRLETNIPLNAIIAVSRSLEREDQQDRLLNVLSSHGG